MDDITIKAYEAQAGEYDRETAEFWDNFPTAFVEDFRRACPPTARVLNVGSGPGRDGSLLYAAGLNVTCLDASRKMVEMSKERGLWSVHGDFMHLPFPDKSFDGVWAYTSLLHIKKAELPAALTELRRVLRGGGILALGMIAGRGEGYRESSGMNLPRWFAFYTAEQLTKIFQKTCFEVLEMNKFKPGKKFTYLNFLVKKTG